MSPTDPVDALATFLHDHPRLFVLTGAGISTASGIPDYRDLDGAWKRPAPVQYREFLEQSDTRRRYWAGSLIGWPSFARARPNVGHRALTQWEAAGLISQLVTQNVDRLHQQAGAQRVIDLHGRLDRVTCLDCGAGYRRAAVQQDLIRLNPAFAVGAAELAPDGDAYLAGTEFDGFRVPACPQCAGTLKPDVVFFGEAIPRARVERAADALRQAAALLVIGSSLMVYSGFRFCRLAAEHGIPVVAINPGRTRADHLLAFKVPMRFEDLLHTAGDRLPGVI